MWDRAYVCIRPVEETDLVIKVRGRNLVCLCSSLFSPIPTKCCQLVCGTKTAPTLCAPFFFVQHVRLTDQSQTLSGVPFLSPSSLYHHSYTYMLPSLLPFPRSIQNSNTLLQPAPRHPTSAFFTILFPPVFSSTTSQPPLTRFQSRS